MKRFKTIIFVVMFSLLFSLGMFGIVYGDGFISGTVSYTGTQTGAIYVAAFTSPLSCTPPNPEPYKYIELLSLGSYTLSGLPDGTYYVASAIATCGSDCDMKLTDPWGIYNGCSNITPVAISGGNAVSGINITLVDGTTANPNPFFYGDYPSDVQSGHHCFPDSPDSYSIRIYISDPDHTATLITVTGPGINGVLTFNPGDYDNYWESWVKWVDLSSGSPPPYPLPLQYNIAITDPYGTLNKNASVNNFVENCASNLFPSITDLVTGNPVFSWTVAGDPYTYGLIVRDYLSNYVWSIFGLTTTTVTYQGPPLTQGATYEYEVLVFDSEDNFSAVDGRFIIIITANLFGDMNNDGIVDISDVILELRMALKIDPVQPCSDINNDGIVDISDVILTLRMALGIDPLQQCS